MREIKFRAWDKKEKRMLPVFQFDFWNNGNLRKVDLGQDEFDVPEEAELMQYTGLKDKNDKEIYEGDIIKFLQMSKEGEVAHILPVIWDEKAAGFHCDNDKTQRGIDMASGYDSINGEVIGNIYETPELLKIK